MDEYRIESEGIVMSETSEQRKAQDKYIADLRLQQMARAANRIDNVRGESTERIAQMATERFDRTINARVAKNRKQGK
tara:strand:+ start:190 stop:423 length:234 start_codon:yes stop_codon:yes gene_type:complete